MNSRNWFDIQSLEKISKNSFKRESISLGVRLIIATAMIRCLKGTQDSTTMSAPWRGFTINSRQISSAPSIKQIIEKKQFFLQLWQTLFAMSPVNGCHILAEESFSIGNSRHSWSEMIKILRLWVTVSRGCEIIVTSNLNLNCTRMPRVSRHGTNAMLSLPWTYCPSEHLAEHASSARQANQSPTVTTWRAPWFEKRVWFECEPRGRKHQK